MSQRIRCPKCRRVFVVGEVSSDGLIECSECHQRLKWSPKVPQAAASPAAEDMAPVKLVSEPRGAAGKRGSRKLRVAIVVGGVAIVGLAAGVIYMAAFAHRPAPTPAVDAGQAPSAAAAPAAPVAPPAAPAPKPPAPPATSLTDLDPSSLFAKASPAVVCIEILSTDAVKRAQGSGFLVSSDGMIVTNYHVMRAGRRGLVRFGDGKALPVAAVLAQDVKKDLAVLKVDGADLPYLELLPEKQKPVVGSRVFAIGTPAGYTNTLSEGLVSGLREEEGDVAVVQTTAPISSGSSGGPLLDLRARVIGVNTYVHVSSAAGRVVENLNFAVSSREAREILQSAADAKAKRSAAVGKPLDAQSAFDLAQAYELVGKGRWLDAWALVKALWQRNPENAHVLLLVGLCNMRMGFPDEAVKAYEVVIRLRPDDAQGYVGIGSAYVKKKMWKEAADTLAQAVRLCPEDAAAQQGLGTALRQLHREDEALAALKKAVDLDADDGRAWMELGEAYLAAKLFTSAEESFAEGIKRDPDNPFSFVRLGLAACQGGHVREAMRAIEVAIKLEPGLPEAYHVMGLVMHRMGDKEGVARVVEYLEKRDPRLAEQLTEATRTPAAPVAPESPAEEKKDTPQAK